jgi:hypothetical protein
MIEGEQTFKLLADQFAGGGSTEDSPGTACLFVLKCAVLQGVKGEETLLDAATEGSRAAHIAAGAYMLESPPPSKRKRPPSIVKSLPLNAIGNRAGTRLRPSATVWTKP